MSQTDASRGDHRPSAALSHDMLFVVFSKLLYLITRLAVPPIVLAHVGLADYGLWTTCFILVSYIGMSASGFAVVYVRFVAEYHVKQDHLAISRLLSTGFITMGVLAMVLILALWLAMPRLLELFNVAPQARETATVLWLGACAIFLFDASIGAYGYVLHGLQRIRREQQIWVVAYLLETGLIVLFLRFGMGIYALLAAFAVRYVFSIGASAIAVRQTLPQLHLGLRYFDRRCLRIFFGFGTWVQVGGLLGTFLQSIDRMMAGLMMGPAATALMDLASKLPSTGASLASSVSMVALPAAARQGALGADSKLLAVYTDSVRMTAWLAGMILPPLACFAPLVITAWLGTRTDTMVLAAILSWSAVTTHLHIMTGPASSVFRGLGRITNEYIYHGLRLVTLGVGLSVLWFAMPWSPVNLATALGISGLMAAAAYLLISHRQLTHSWAGLGSLYFGPFALPYLLALVALLLIQWWALPKESGRLGALLHLTPAVLLYALLAMAAAWLWVLTPAQRQAVRQRLPWGASKHAAQEAKMPLGNVDQRAPGGFR